MHSLRVFLNERLAAAAEEIFEAVEKTIAEYKEEISRSKDLEIGRLRMQLKLLKSGWFFKDYPRRNKLTYGFLFFEKLHGSDVLLWVNYLEASLDRSLGAQPEQHHHHHHPPPPHQHQSFPAVVAPESQHCEDEDDDDEEEGSGSLEQEHPAQPSQVKKEHPRSHRDFWMDQDAEQLESLESDMKDFITSPSGLRGGLQEPPMSFHVVHSNSNHHHHGGEEGKDKPYCCSVCEKRFGNCSHLAAHIRTHTGERPYRCEICRKTFITTSALNRHQTIHTEGKHFVCSYCGKSFKWMESLGRHVRIVHKRDGVPA